MGSREGFKSKSSTKGTSLQISKNAAQRTNCRYLSTYTRKKRAQVPRDVRIRANKVKVMENQQRARNLRKQKQLERSKKALEMYNTDVNYQFSALFANLLKADTECLKSGITNNFSLAGNEEQMTVAELQWKRMVNDMLQNGRLTNCIAVSDVSGKGFDEILKVAVAAKLSEDQMIKTVFVFSDMEFDKALKNPWETDYMVIQKKFKENGYERVPDIMFGNLRDSFSTPVTTTQNGVAICLVDFQRIC
ncbi:hypothetical protein AgCh_032418 [Apium graveolens]